MGGWLRSEYGAVGLIVGACLFLGCSETKAPDAITTCPSGTVRAGDTCVPPSGVDGGDLPPLVDAGEPGDAAEPVDAADAEPRPDTGVARDATVPPDSGPADTGVVEPATLPFWIDDYYIMSGFMGGGTVESTPCASDPGNAASPCRMITWTPGGADWAGFYFQYPANNWTRPGLPIAPGATRVSFSVWGATGTESLNFAAGIRAADGFQLETGYSIAGTTPTRHTIELGATTYTNVAGAFAWFVNNPSGAASVTFYLDDVRWE